MRFIIVAGFVFLIMACSKNDPTPPNPTPPDVDTLGIWQVKKIDTLARTLQDVTFTSATTGFACGEKNALFKTSDGGTTWQSVAISAGNNYSNIQFLNAQYGFIASNGGGGRDGVLRTTNGGATWQFGATPTSAIDVFFVSPALGFCASSNGLLKSIDSGKTWTPIPSATISFASSLWFFDASKGFVTTQAGIIYRTMDGGANFSVAATYPGSSYEPVYFANATNGCTGLGKSLHITNDGGTTWQLLKTFASDVVDVKNIGSSEYYVCTGTEVWHSTNGGATWLREMKLSTLNAAVEFTLTQPGKTWVSGSSGRLYFK